MSRAYQVQIAESVTRVVHLTDGVQTQLDLLPILTPERMGQILLQELAKRGFKVEGEKAVRQEGDIQIEIDAKTATVSVRIQEERTVTASAKESRSGDDKAKVEAAARDAAKKSAEDAANKIEEEARRAMTERLEKSLRDLKGELDGVMNRVLGQALTERAGQLGEIVEVSGDAQEGNLTIRVRV
jgi:hypothetical protein